MLTESLKIYNQASESSTEDFDYMMESSLTQIEIENPVVEPISEKSIKNLGEDQKFNLYLFFINIGVLIMYVFKAVDEQIKKQKDEN